MGAFYLIAHLLHVPVWLTERLWMSLLITLGFWGLVRLAEALGIGMRGRRGCWPGPRSRCGRPSPS